jgi:hypothetical protein
LSITIDVTNLMTDYPGMADVGGWHGMNEGAALN